MVDIFDRTDIEKLGSNFLKELDKYPQFDCFWGCTYNTSPDFIEKNLLSRFEQIKVIIGLTGTNALKALDNHLQTAPALNDYLTKHEDGSLVNRIKDESVTLKYTKDRMIHTKLYVLFSTESGEYRAYLGSMNLSDQALKSNRELLMCDHGQIDDLLFQKVYQPLMDDLWQDSTDFLNARIIKGWEEKSTVDDRKLFIADEVLNKMLKKTVENQDTDGSIQTVEQGPEISFTSKEVNDVKKKLDVSVTPTIEQDQKDASNALKIIFTSTGQPKNLSMLEEETRHQLMHVIYHESDPDKPYEVIGEKLENNFPKPMLVYSEEENKFYKAPAFGSAQQSQLLTHKPSRKELQDIIDIVKFYQNTKQRDESLAAFSYLMYVLESANIWKIRKLVDKLGVQARLGDIPTVCALIGQGGTGKSTLLEIAEGLTTGNEDNIILAGDDKFRVTAEAKRAFKNGKPLKKGSSATSDTPAVNNNNLWELADAYMRTKSSVTPMFIDDPQPSFITSAKGEQSLKRFSNSYKNAPHPVVIVALNSQSDRDTNVVLNAQTRRRAYMISQENQFKERSQEEKDFTTHIQTELTSTVYEYLTQKIDQYLTHVYDEEDMDEYNKIDQDFLYPVKKAFSELLADEGMLDDYIEQYLTHNNYDFQDDAGRRNWRALLSDKNVMKQLSFSTNEDTKRRMAFVPRNAFPGTAYKSGISEYFDYIPSSLDICATKQSAGLNLDVENMDQWLGVNTLNKLFEDDQGITDARLKQNERREDQQMMMETFFKLQKAEEEKKKENNLLHRLFHKK